MFEKEIEEYESVRLEYQQKIADRIGKKQWMAALPCLLWWAVVICC